MSHDRPLQIVSGSGSYVQAGDGRTLLDLRNGFGSVFLGHCNPEITDALVQQLGQVWTTGRISNPTVEQAYAKIEALLPSGMRFAGSYSTGMEVSEYAARVATAHTGRRRLAGFARSMHGKSAMTAALSWERTSLGNSDCHILPFVHQAAESEILNQVEDLLAHHEIAAVLVEPIQGSNSGFEASLDFYESLLELCELHGTLCVFDEILTGLYRTGPLFFATRLTRMPDILLFAKSMGNGFPMSGMAVRESIETGSRTLPGSTFSDSPLAAAAAGACLSVMERLPMEFLVDEIDQAVRAAFLDLPASAGTVRGRGALWCIDFADLQSSGRVRAAVEREGILISSQGSAIRLLPSALVACDVLGFALARVAAACADESFRKDTM
jgi:acetylornithine/succinyldiaminopimelate/putrescine aminotransferase